MDGAYGFDGPDSVAGRHFADDYVGPGWDVVGAERALEARVGVSMTGFRQHGPERLDMCPRPLPAITMVFGLGPAELTIADAQRRREARSGLAGLTPAPTLVSGWGVECVEVRMSPLSAYTIFGGASADLSRQMVGLDDVWGREETRICEQLAERKGWNERFSLVETALAKRVESGPEPDPEVSGAWTQILASRGKIPVEQLAAACGWSRKRLWSRFTAQIGLTPKRAAMLVRFDAAARRLSSGEDSAVVAAICGYSDQSHLHRDVKEFAGLTPRELAGAAPHTPS